MMAGKDNADSKYIWMDGKMIPYSEARIHVLAHSLHYGTAAFEGMRAYNVTDGGTALFRANEHFDRFLASIQSLGCITNYTKSDYIRAACECIKQNLFRECYIRPIAYIDDSVRGLKLPEDPTVLSAIAVWNWGKYMGVEGYLNGICAGISSFRRPDVSSHLSYSKLSSNYLTSVLARREATKNRMDEAILLDPNGFVAEGSGENIFMVKDGMLFTPPTGYILPGITRDAVIQLGRSTGYTVTEANITRNQLYTADEIFFTGTAVEITPIREVDHYRIGSGKPGPITRRIGELFTKAVHGDLPEFRKWLTVV